MLKAVVAATAAVTIASSGLAYAQHDERQFGAKFETKADNGDLAMGEATRLAGKSSADKTEPAALSGKFTGQHGASFGRKLMTGEPPAFGPKAATSI
jgi:hypothetical protein